MELSTIYQYLTDIEIQIIEKWINERDALCAKLYDKEANTIISFALIHKLDFDPYNKHNKPSYIDFIFTIPEFRRTGAALELLKQLRTVQLQATTSVNIPESLKLFNKAGYKCSGKSNGCLMLQS
jgi:predicted acetyltransferase